MRRSLADWPHFVKYNAQTRARDLQRRLTAGQSPTDDVNGNH